MHFLDGQKKHDYMAQLIKKKSYVELPMECACQKHGCLNKTTHATWHRNKHSFLLRPLCPKCYETSDTPQAPVVKSDTASKLPAKKQPEDKPKVMSNKELSERIAQLEEVSFNHRTVAQAQELNDLLILRKKRTRANVKKK